MKKMLSLMLIMVCALAFADQNAEQQKTINEMQLRSCVANMRALESAIEMYLLDYDASSLTLDKLKEYVSGNFPTCPAGHDYTVVMDRKNPYIKCQIHNTSRDPKLPEIAPISTTETAPLLEAVEAPVVKEAPIILKNGTTRGGTDTIARIRALLGNLQKEKKIIQSNNRKIEALLFKNWLLQTEFEADMTTLLPIFRASNESFGNLGNNVKDLKAEIFDPSQLCFTELEQSLSKSGTAISEAYAAMRTGKSELQTARTGYTASRAEFERTLALIDKLTAQ
ncbi:MAG: hypothetical protein PHW04_18820, partial [Candidatus Wallbacteria bacterium]|nr:hypothetical protein [Candidatus Wallbacteria bacterium]